jgi:putative ATP-binding cassette transporter
MDSDTEALLYALLTEELPESTIVSIAHRETVAQYHDLRWQFVADGGAAPEDARLYRIEASDLPVRAQPFASQASARRTQ